MATFSDLRALGYRELDVVVSNSTKRQAEMFSAQTTPNVAVAEAVRMSMSTLFTLKRCGSIILYE